MSKTLSPATDSQQPTILLVGPRARDQITGLMVAFETLIDGLRAKGTPHIVIPTDAAGASRQPGALRFHSAISALYCIFTLLRHLGIGQIVYLPLATSLLGFARDATVIWSASIARRRVVGHLHGGGYLAFFNRLPRFLKSLVKATILRLDTIIVLADPLRGEFSFIDVHKDRIIVVNNGLPSAPGHLIASECSREIGKSVRLLFLSNLIESKGYWDLLEACRILRDRYKLTFSCSFCGKFIATSADENQLSAKAAEEQFLARISEYKLSDCVAYHGPVDSAEKWELLQNSHVFVLPTYYPWEGQPISIIEALAFSIPVITTAHKGIGELVVDGFNGILVSKQSPADIAAAVYRLTTHKDEYLGMRRNAYRHYHSRFTREAHLDSLTVALLGAHGADHPLDREVF